MMELVGDATCVTYCQTVDQWFTDNGIANLKQYNTTYDASFGECGSTVKDGEVRSMPSDGFAQHNTLGDSHRVPCELWCDGTRVVHSPNCLDDFAGQQPAMIPFDVATCQASSEMMFYWMALHQNPWQAYINCVALDDSVQDSTATAVSNVTANAQSTSPSSITISVPEDQTPTSSVNETAIAVPAEATEAPVPSPAA